MVKITYKLYDFFEEFNNFRSEESNHRFGCENMSKNLIRHLKKGNIYFKNKKSICPSCKSHKIIEDGNYPRILYFLNFGKRKCFIKVYKCLECGKKFVTDMKSLVDENKNITKPVIDCILKLYSIFGDSLYKIQNYLKEQHKISISHQSIENILLSHKKENKVKYWSYSGYYLFDALWIRINGDWKYILALFDLKINTIINYEIVDSESSKVIYSFLSQSTRNQPRNYIVTDLKKEYREVIYKLGFKHQFCRFHTKQKINRDINNYLKKNKVDSEEEDKINWFKLLIFNILDSETLENAKEIRNDLFSKNKEFPKIINDLYWKFTVPYFKNLTYYLEFDFIDSTSNKIENFFQKVFPKHIKKKFRSKNGVTSRFELRIKYWEQNNLQRFRP